METNSTKSGASLRRAVPRRMDAAMAERLRWLLRDPDHWVLRTSWERFLRSGDEALLIDTEHLTQDQCAAAYAWLSQQRHALHRSLEGTWPAPDGWLEELPMVRTFLRRKHPSAHLRSVPRQPGGPPLRRG